MRSSLALILILAGCGGRQADPNSTAGIARYPQTIVASLGETAEFTVECVGGGLKYRWWHKGHRIPGATSPTLRIPAVTDDDFGDYRVDVIHGDNARGVFAELIETGAPTLVSQTTGEPVGGKVTMAVSTDGDPTPTYQWCREATLQHPAEPIDGATGPTLTVPVPSAGTDRYSVFATNRKGYVWVLFGVDAP